MLMMQKSLGMVRWIGCVASVSMTIGCDMQEPATSPAIPGTVRPSLAASPVRASRPDEEPFAQIARQIPSYGGHFLDEQGRLTAYVVSDQDQPAARAKLVELANSNATGLSRRRYPSLGAVRVLRGQFTFQQLSDWRDSVFTNLLGKLDGVISDDLDEAHNVVTVGIRPGSEQSVQPQVLTRLAASGIPAAAIRFVTENPKEATGVPDSLLTHSPVLVGGLGMTWSQNSGTGNGGGCTIGYTATLADGRQAMITAMHCSGTKATTESTWYFQPYGGGETSFAYEFYDPTAGNCPLLWACTKYRYSDANLNLIWNNAGGRDFYRGVIVRPSERVSGRVGSRGVSASNPYLFVTGTATNIYQGETLDKIGASTGWTYGAVSSTCTDYLQAEPAIRCAYKVSLYVNDGDSGGPVFAYDGLDGAVAKGLATAKDGTSTMWFSKWSYVYDDLNPSNQYQPNIVYPTTTISVSLSGSTSGGHPSLTGSATASGSLGSTYYTLYRNTWSYVCDIDNYCAYSPSSSPVYSSTTPPPASLVDTYFSTSGVSTSPTCPNDVSSAVYTLSVYKAGTYASSNSVCYDP